MHSKLPTPQKNQSPHHVGRHVVCSNTCCARRRASSAATHRQGGRATPTAPRAVRLKAHPRTVCRRLVTRARDVRPRSSSHKGGNFSHSPLHSSSQRTTSCCGSSNFTSIATLIQSTFLKLGKNCSDYFLPV